MNDITTARTTIIKFSNSEITTIDDDWTNPDADRSLDVDWVGCTIFRRTTSNAPTTSASTSAPTTGTATTTSSSTTSATPATTSVPTAGNDPGVPVEEESPDAGPAEAPPEPLAEPRPQVTIWMRSLVRSSRTIRLRTPHRVPPHRRKIPNQMMTLKSRQAGKYCSTTFRNR